MLNRRDVVQGAAALAAVAALPLPAGAMSAPSSAAKLETLIYANADKAHAGLVVTADAGRMREGVAFFEERGNAPIYLVESVEQAKMILRERAGEVAALLTEGDDWKTVWLAFAREDMARYGHIGVIRF